MATLHANEWFDEDSRPIDAGPEGSGPWMFDAPPPDRELDDWLDQIVGRPKEDDLEKMLDTEGKIK